MSKKSISPNIDVAKNLLDKLWKEVINEETEEIDPDIDRLINSQSVAIRYCLPTQLLGKFTDGKLNCLRLQKGELEDESSWDPRGFASKVIVLWVSENQNVLGTSSDPYVSKPLRRKKLEPDPGNVKQKEEWKLLYKILKDVEDRNSKEYTRTRLLQTLRSIYRKYAELTFEYFIPQRISLEQTKQLINNFLSESSGGERGLALAAALFTTFGKYFKLYKEVRREAINASDAATGLAGDIECIDEENNIKLAIEVKERELTLTDVKNSILKARRESINELLFNAPGINTKEKQDIYEEFSKTWASGTNIYQVSIQELMKVGLSLTGEEGRKDFLINIGDQLDRYNTQPTNRQRWKELLESL